MMYSGSKRTEILIDESNFINQLHSCTPYLGIRPLKELYRGIENYLNLDPTFTNHHIYGSIPNYEDNPQQSSLRHRFFEALKYDYISIHLGYCAMGPNGKMHEKGVDVNIALDLVDYSRRADRIILLSADGDLAEAIRRAKVNAEVICILGKGTPASTVRSLADRVVNLEDILKVIPEKHLVLKPSKNGYRQAV
ncbi:NYN domain-containing protein [Niallia taxi]|uniref:NYN domain-containing protein n=1 Tax=Niallia taxi TaxID=2499688 RepID=UPI0015F76EED|nr:NYN domain-containing protein [Niallia taxi]